MATIIKVYKKDQYVYYHNSKTNEEFSIANGRVNFQASEFGKVYLTLYVEERYATVNKNKVATANVLISNVVDQLDVAYGTTVEEIHLGFNKGINVKIQNEAEEYIDVQNPLPTNGDSVYGKDLDLTRSDTTGWTGNLSDLFGDMTVGLTYTGTDNPKSLTVYFERTVLTHAAAFTANTGNFSNLKIIALVGGGVELPMYDGSSDDTDTVSQSIQFSPIGVEGFRFEFHTADDVTISNAIIFKTSTVVSRIQAISELSGSVENVNSYRKALNVNSAWVHRKIVNETYHQDTANVTNPATGISAGDTTITVDDATGFITGDEIKLEEVVDGVGQQEIGIMTLTNVVGSVLTLDRPVGFDYTPVATVTEVITNMAVAGTLANPQIFEIDPPDGTVWQFTRVMFSLVHATAADDGKFGGIAALTNGVCLRATTAAGRTVVFANWKTNADMKLDMFNVEYSSKAPAGNNGTNGRWTFTNAEVIAELDGDSSPIQKLEVLVQDDLTGLISYYQRGQGRVFSP